MRVEMITLDTNCVLKGDKAHMHNTLSVNSNANYNTKKKNEGEERRKGGEEREREEREVCPRCRLWGQGGVDSRETGTLVAKICPGERTGVDCMTETWAIINNFVSHGDSRKKNEREKKDGSQVCNRWQILKLSSYFPVSTATKMCKNCTTGWRDVRASRVLVLNVFQLVPYLVPWAHQE